METSKGDNLRLDEAEELDGISSGVDDDDGTEAEAEVDAAEDCVPLCAYEPVGCDVVDDDDDIRLFMAE